MFDKLDLGLAKLKEMEPMRVFGRISRVAGLTVESDGPAASIGEVLKVEGPGGDVPFQVIGFNGSKVISMPLGELRGLTTGQKIYSTGKYPSLRFDERALGRVLNGMGEPIDGGPPIEGGEFIDIYRDPTNAMARENIGAVMGTGVKAIDGMITLGTGQRVGIFAGSGVGKSTLMGMIARNTSADINVICLVGERGRELKEFIEKSLGEEGLKRSVVVAATSDESPLLKILACFTATAIAEYFSDKGNNVLLMMDSLTRMAMAQREVGLSAGEPPSTKGYTPSVFALMPKLLERAGNFTDKGSITGIYTVLVEGDDVTEPVADHARSILDGHIVLSRDIAHRNHYPAIDTLGSVSRLMSEIVDDDHQLFNGKMRELMAVYKDVEDLINIGAYSKGANPGIDEAVDKIGGINNFLRQGVYEKVDFSGIKGMMAEALK